MLKPRSVLAIVLSGCLLLQNLPAQVEATSHPLIGSAPGVMSEQAVVEPTFTAVQPLFTKAAAHARTMISHPRVLTLKSSASQWIRTSPLLPMSLLSVLTALLVILDFNSTPMALAFLVTSKLRTKEDRHFLGWMDGDKVRKTKSSFHDTILTHRLAAALNLKVPLRRLDKILTPVQDIEVDVEFFRDNGERVRFKAWRIVSDYPGKGGLRALTNVSREDVESLQQDMDIKPSDEIMIEGQPLRGAKGGLQIKLTETVYSPSEKARAMRAYVDGIMQAVWEKQGRVAFGPLFDTPAPDVGTSLPEINLMDYFAEEALRWQVTHFKEIYPWLKKNDPKTARALKILMSDLPDMSSSALDLPYADRVLKMRSDGRLTSLRLLATVTGKSLKYGGIAGRGNATGQGMLFTLFEFLKITKDIPADAIDLQGIKMIIEGLGNVGYGTAITALKMNAKIEAIFEFDPIKNIDFVLYTPKGFEKPLIQRMKRYKDTHGSLIGFRDEDEGIKFFMSKDDFWTYWKENKLSFKVFAPSAMQETVTVELVEKFDSKVIILEGANGATTLKADEILKRKGITALPDVVANSGGVLVSWMEMLQDTEENGKPWTEEDVYRKLHRLIQNRVFQIHSYTVSNPGKTLRDAAHELWLVRRIAAKDSIWKQLLGPIQKMKNVLSEWIHDGLNGKSTAPQPPQRPQEERLTEAA